MNREASNQHRKGNSRCGGCEWSTEEDTEDVDEDPDAVEGTSVLWKQTICIDLCDRENVHLSHLQSSITVHVSQGSAASSEIAGLFGSYNYEDSPLSISSISSKHRNHSNSGDGQDNEMKIMLQQTDKAPDQKRCRHEDGDTSDEDQEELPYDSELHFNATHHNHDQNQNSRLTRSVNMKCAQSSGEFSFRRYVEESSEHVADQEHGQVLASSPDYLLRHFSQDELLKGTRLIEAETMPEMSLLESLDESIMIRASSSPGTNSMRIMSRLEFSRSESQTNSDCLKGSDLLCNGNVVSSPVAELDLSEDKKHDVEETLNSSCSLSTPNLYKEDIQTGKVPLGRTRSCGELKYGQGQVHYPRPDFSKVAPKVKIPKTSTVSKTGSNTAVDRTPSQQGVSGKTLPSCKADVISRVLEDTFWVPKKSKLLQDEEEQLKLDHDLQTECNRLLTKYESNDNHQNVWPSVKPIESFGETHLSIHCGETINKMDLQHRKYQIGPVTQTNPGLVEETRETKQQDLTEGQRLTNELKDIINQFVIKVDEFKKCINNMSMTFEEQQLVNFTRWLEMFKSMMDAQDQLERHYMSKKEEHRTLEMQSYISLNKNTGEFDPDRQVEGEIFRLGMHLEDIKEQIDRNSCRELVSLSSTSHISPPDQDFIQESQFSFSKKEKHVHAGAKDFFGPSPSLCSESSIRSREDEEGSVIMPVVEDDNEDVLAQITNQVSLKPHQTPSRSTERTAHTDETLQQQSNEKQAYVSPETDSGFATSERSRPPTGLSLAQDSITKSHANRISGTSMTDSVTSVSNVHTAVCIASCTEPDQFSCNIQNLEWNYSTHNAPVSLHMIENVPDGTMPSVAQMQEAGHKERSHSLLMQRHTASIQTNSKHSNCTCSNSEAIHALQYEVSQLKRLLEESLGPLAHLSRLNLNTHERSVRARPSSRPKYRSSSSRCLNMGIQKVEGWILSDFSSNRSKASSENLSLNTCQSRPCSSHHPRSSDGSTIHKRDTNARPASCSTEVSNGPTYHRGRSITRPINHDNRPNQGLTLHRNSSDSNTGCIRSCFSLPSGFKVKDRQSDTEGTRRRSTQSDSALLQSDDYFDWVPSFPTSTHRSRQKAPRHRANKAEAISSTLDKALEAVSLMKQTTDRMAKTLSEDLSKARLYRTFQSQHISERKKT